MPDKWIYLSPHFDDAALSVGGLIWEQVNQGDSVEIWTICGVAASPDQPLSDFARSLHSIWKAGQAPVQQRAQEDIQACRVLGAAYRHLPWLDCIYRLDAKTGLPLVQYEEDLYKPFSQSEKDELVRLLSKYQIPEHAQIAVPFGFGNHRDHTVVRAVAEELYGSVWHYADYPYVIQRQIDIFSWISEGFIPLKRSLTGAGLQPWKNAIACYSSQLPVFWKDIRTMYVAVDEFASVIKDQYADTFLWKF